MKIVFFDIDGTLLNQDNEIPDLTKAAIKNLQENGVYVAIATGRAPFMFEHIREELGIDSYVSFNGQYVVFENEVIYKNPLKAEKLESLMMHAHENQHPLVFLNEKTMKSSVDHHEYIEESLKSLGFPHPDENASFYIGRDIFQALVFCEGHQEDVYLKSYDDFHFIRWHQYSTDVLPAGGSKAEGIKQLIVRLGLDFQDVYAFGDGLNDIEMLKSCGTGVAMGNASEVVKAAADMITDHVDEDGIWKGLKQLTLI
ncbi:Cof-type HAD-IIB family hydrolase [Cytobacillus purgationiresistens]|uniref:Cof subfamily protein (Haloacid dehalogenase superfamily) n=1 Tax=Cytobacillus purgationiresistens TaxID=863449 RepID=A0ABU0AMI4_9BACI|nr:Cof-type HAD-IIB family hydrolase [Cytobacillus purgationiresistens]MDQ0272447.1 Cof subfamily protein (haloacid dehalogenase superfamily) [Cytobacillus purgationiresistens]